MRKYIAAFILILASLVQADWVGTHDIDDWLTFSWNTENGNTHAANKMYTIRLEAAQGTPIVSAIMKVGKRVRR